MIFVSCSCRPKNKRQLWMHSLILPLWWRAGSSWLGRNSSVYGRQRNPSTSSRVYVCRLLSRLSCAYLWHYLQINPLILLLTLTGYSDIATQTVQGSGAILRKTKQAVLVGEYEPPIQAGEATPIVENLGDYLVSTGY